MDTCVARATQQHKVALAMVVLAAIDVVHRVGSLSLRRATETALVSIALRDSALQRSREARLIGAQAPTALPLRVALSGHGFGVGGRFVGPLVLVLLSERGR